MDRWTEADGIVVIVLPLSFQDDMHILNRSSTSSFVFAFQNFIPFSHGCSDSINISAHQDTQRGFSVDLLYLGIMMTGWGRLAIGCFGPLRCFIVM